MVVELCCPFVSRVEFGVSMEGKAAAAAGEDVYEFKSGKETASVRGTSVSPDVEKKEGHVNMSDGKEPRNSPATQESPTDQSNKRSYAEINDAVEDGDEENKRKKRKDPDSGKENLRNGSGVSGRFGGGRNGNSAEKCSKVANTSKNGSNSATKSVHGSGNSNSDRRSPSSTGGSAGSSPKLATACATSGVSSSKSLPGLASESDGETDESRGGKCGSSSNPEAAGSLTASSTWTAGPKVPPLKIVIPQQSAAMEQEQGNRNGKNGTTRHHQALPYVVASSNSADSVPDKEASGTVGPASASNSGSSSSELGSNNSSVKNDEKKESVSGPLLPEDQRSTHHQRVLRSSHRSGACTSVSTCGSGSGSAISSSNALSTSSTSVTGTSAPSPAAPGSNNNSTVERGSNNSSPSQSSSQQQSPSPAEPIVPLTTSEVTTTTSITKSTPSTTVCVSSAPEEKITEPAEQQNQPVPSAPPQPPPVDLHPRKRKMKQSKESQASTAATSASEPSDTTSSTTEVHPHDQPITNCYQLFLNIRKQVCVTCVFISFVVLLSTLQDVCSTDCMTGTGRVKYEFFKHFFLFLSYINMYVVCHTPPVAHSCEIDSAGSY
jgi:hypothetical protein